MNQNVTTGRFLLEFCVLELALSIPFWCLGALAHAGVIPDYQLLYGLWGTTPATAVLILVYWKDRGAGVKALLMRIFDYKRIESKVWYLPIFLLLPFIIFVMYEVAVLSGQQPPSPKFSWLAPASFVFFFLLVPLEELAWTAYLTDGLQSRYSALKASLIVGMLHAVFHAPVWIAAGWSLDWWSWQWVYAVAIRVLFVWIYNNAGRSLFAVDLVHPQAVCYYYLWPVSQNMGVPSFYNPGILAVTTIILATIVTLLWGPKTLAQYKFSHNSRQ